MKIFFKPFFCTFLFIQTAYSCEDWFKALKIKDSKGCEEKCRTSETDMATYMCPQQCDILCKNLNKPIEKDSNFYDLTDDEIAFCKKNPISCAKAYKLSWEDEKICMSIYIRSSTNDESDACRHYIWSLLLSKDLGVENARKILNAHENNPKQNVNEKEMDLKNNELGISDFQKNKNLPTEKYLESYKKNLKEKKLKIIKPKYSAQGGLP
jgi:hypothetical protein